jgi:hypothetical protein
MEITSWIQNYLNWPKREEPKLRDFFSKAVQVTIYAMLGNDDWGASSAHLRELEEQGMLRLIHGQKHVLGDGYELIGYARVPPTPYHHKGR